MNQQDAEEYTQALGQVVAGSWRQIALAKKLGVPKALGISTDQWVNQRLGGYVKLSIAERREAVRNLTDDGLSARQIAEIIGVSHDTAASDVRNLTVDPIDAVAALAADDKIHQTAKATDTRQKNEEKRRDDFARPVNSVLIPGLHHGDFRELSKAIADDSVDLVFTDPPYDGESVSLYGDAAKAARRILKPGGSFIAYSGHRHLPAVLAQCSTYLNYWWTIACVHVGGDSLMQKLGIRAGWKPLVWFVKGSRADVQNILSDVVSGAREKDIHEWQQAEAEASYYIEKLTTPDGIVVDFFVGGGTTAAAAAQLGRQWIGFEIDAAAAERASKRISEVA